MKRLCYTGKRGMGALEYEPAMNTHTDIDEQISLQRMSDFASAILEEKRDVLSEGGRNHFMTKRFDRVNGDKLHMQSLGALLHIDYNEPGLCSNEMAALTGRRLGLPSSDIEQLYRRMVFNVLAVNNEVAAAVIQWKDIAGSAGIREQTISLIEAHYKQAHYKQV